MFVFKSIICQYLGQYYKHKHTYVGISYFFRAYHYCQVLNLIYFNESYNRAEVRQHNILFKEYLELDCAEKHDEARLKLMNIYILANTKLEYIFSFLKKFEQFMKDSNIDTGFNPGKWKPGLMGVEVLGDE